MWVESIIKWLKSDPKHQLVYFIFSNKEYNHWHKDLIMDVEDEYKDELLKRINYANHDSINDLLDQIHIPVGVDIFNIKDVIRKETLRLAKLDEKEKTNSKGTVAVN